MNARVGVIGTGYVGLSTGVCMAHLGHDVVCVDLDEAKIATLQRGKSPIVEHRMDELLFEGIESGRLRFTTDSAAAVADRDVVFLCVQTPQGEDGSADMRHVHAALAGLEPHLKPGAVVVNKSTVPVGSARSMTASLTRDDIRIASNPEFLREGSAIDDFLSPDRVVVGCDDVIAAEKVAALYAPLAATTVITGPETSEMIKYAANAFLATKLSFTNAVATLCELVGADMRDVSRGIGLDRRIGADFLKPGPGWGGSCFPKDSRALVHIADEVGYDFDLMRSVIESNEQQFDRTAEKVVKAAGGSLQGVVVAVWGLTFKANTDDLRDSPSLAIVRRLQAQGAVIRAYDPTVSGPRPGLPDGIECCENSIEACRGAAVLAVLTEWEVFGRVPAADVAAVMSGREVVDGRNMLDRDAWTRHGFHHVGIGR